MAARARHIEPGKHLVGTASQPWPHCGQLQGQRGERDGKRRRRAGGGGQARDRSRMTMASTTSTVLSARKTRRPIPRPICSVTLGARNFSGASRNEMASTMPSQTKITATATARATLTSRDLPGELRQTQIRLDEGVQPIDGDRGPPGFQRSPHEPEVDRADDGVLAFGDFQKRAVPQPDLFVPATLRGKAELVEHTDEVLDRLVHPEGLGGGRGRRIELPTPRAAGGQRLGGAVPLAGNAGAKHLGE